MNELNKVKKGDVLVTKMTNPDMVVAMQRSSAIVTDEGGLTSHAAIVSREMGIPAVVGTGKATQILKDGMFITIDGYRGKIYEGKTSLKAEKAKVEPVVETVIKIKAIVDLPDFAERASKTGCRAVGLTRVEGIIAESGKHPYYFTQKGDIGEYEEVIYSGISKIAEYFDEIWVRTSDIRSDEYRNLEGAPKEVEMNPMIGMHGIRASLKHKEILKAELKAIKRVSESKKIGIMVPQLILVDEIREVKKMLNEIGITENLKIGVMIETPAAVQIIDNLCKEGIDFISFGTNDLTQFTLAIDRGNEEVQYLYDEMHPAVLKQISYVIATCKKYGVETSICGQAGSDKKMVEFLVSRGIDSISVNADKAREISELVRELEKNKTKEAEEKKDAEKEENSEEVKQGNEDNSGKAASDLGIFDVFSGEAKKSEKNSKEEKEVFYESNVSEILEEEDLKTQEADKKEEKHDVYLNIF